MSETVRKEGTSSESGQNGEGYHGTFRALKGWLKALRRGRNGEGSLRETIEELIEESEVESDDTPERILDFYRRVLRGRGEVVECRGTINIHRRRGDETVSCLDRPSSRAVRLVTGVEGAHSVVVVTTHGSTTQFAVLGIHTGD